MLRQSSSRNHRSRGLKLKKALQISLLVVVSVWLLYQVKHSYEKKTVYNENNDNIDTGDVHKDDQSQGEVIRLGRKDLPAKMEADSSTLDERVEDEETEEIEQEMKHDEHDDDPIDEPDLDKDDDLPEPGKDDDLPEHSADKDEGSDGVGVFEDEERKERSQEDQEKSFHGDDVSSAVTHDPPSSQHAAELAHHAQEKILYVDDASTAVPHENQEPEHKELEAHKATEKSSTRDNVSSSVDHDAQIAKPLPDEQLKSMDRIFEGTTNLSNGITLRGPGVNGTDAAGEHGASSTNSSSNPNLSTTLVSESKTDPAPENLTNKDAGTGISNSTSLKGQHKQQVKDSAVALNNQTQFFTDLTSAELNSPPNGTLTLVSTDPQKATSRDGDDGGNTGTSSTPVSNKADDIDSHKEDVDVSTKIMNKAIGEGEVLPE